MDYLETGPAKEELQGAIEVIASFLIGLKNYALYPENHGICQKSVENASTRLEWFLKSYEVLRLEVAKDRLLYKSEVVFEESGGEENLATVLFRDGIQWLQFLEGFGFDELKGFFRVLTAYKTCQEDGDGDLVTAFWEENFPNFRYKAADVYWESEPLLDYALLDTGDTEDYSDTEPEEAQQGLLAVNTEDSVDTLWTLTANEAKKLRKMISEEESRDNLSDLLFIIFVLLKDQTKNEDLKLALEFLEGELRETLEQGNFQFAFRLISGVWKIRSGAKAQKLWGMDDLDQFFLKISRPEVLYVVPQERRSLDALDPATIKLFSQFFLLLPPTAISALGPMLGKTRSPNIQQKVLQIIEAMAAKDIDPLEQLLDSPDDIMVEKLVSVLGRLKGERPVQILLKMLRHPSDGVRKQAARQLPILDEGIIKKLFVLIEDSNESIRSLVLRKLGKTRSEITEALLLDYLGKRQFTISTHQHLLACYRALGQSGSHRSVEFLQKSLFDRGWFPDFGSVHRRGATVALKALGTIESKELLQKASKSLFPTIRLAYRSIGS